MLSTIWSASIDDGIATTWLEDESLAPVSDATVPLGTNGLRFHDGAVWASNISKGTLLEIPIDNDRAGTPRLVTYELPGVDDFSFLAEDSSVVLATLNDPNKLILVCEDGSTSTVLDESDGLSSPTSVVVDGQTVRVSNAGIAEPFEASILQARIDAAATGC